KEAQGADGLVENAPRGLLVLQQVQLVGADFLRAEQVGGAAEVAGEANEVAQVGLARARAVVAQVEVVEKALTQGRHGSLLAGEGPSSVAAAEGYTIARGK